MLRSAPGVEPQERRDGGHSVKLPTAKLQGLHSATANLLSSRVASWLRSDGIADPHFYATARGKRAFPEIVYRSLRSTSRGRSGGRLRNRHILSSPPLPSAKKLLIAGSEFRPLLSGLLQDMDTPAKKPKKLSRVLNGLKRRLKGDSRTGQRLDEGIESARNRNVAVEAISDAEIVPGAREPVPNALRQPERREYLPQQAPLAPIRLPQGSAFSVQPSVALPAFPDVRWGEVCFTLDGTEKQSKQKVSDTPDNEEDSCVQEDTEDATKQGAAGSNPGPSRPTETAVILDKQLKDDGGRDADDSSPGDTAHTDSTGKTSYLSAPVKNTYTTPGYEWASKSQGYDWTSRKQHYGHDNPTMSEAYQRELGRREKHLAHTQEKVQKMKEDTIGEESKEPGIKMGYMYHA